jgi:hypothetical protein
LKKGKLVQGNKDRIVLILIKYPINGILFRIKEHLIRQILGLPAIQEKVLCKFKTLFGRASLYSQLSDILVCRLLYSDTYGFPWIKKYSV